MSNTISEMLSKASLFLAAAAAHSHTFSPSQSAHHSVCVALVWFPLHQGGGPKRKHNMTRSGFSLEREIQSFVFSFSVPGQGAVICGALHFIWPLFLLFYPGNGPCQQQCTSVGGRPHCSCFPGFSLMNDGLSCAGEQWKHLKTAFSCLFLRFFGATDQAEGR